MINMSNNSLASTNIEQEKELLCLIIWLDATAQAIGDLLSGFGPARAWIDKHRDELERGLLKKEWDDRITELDNARKEIISYTAKALDYTGRVAGAVPTDHPKDAIDLLVEVKLRAELFSYPGFLGWELIDNQRLILENEMADAEQRLEHMAEVMKVLPVKHSKSNSDEYRSAQWFTINTNIPVARLRQATSTKRKAKHVKTKQIDGVICYSVEDVKQWWPQDITKP